MCHCMMNPRDFPLKASANPLTAFCGYSGIKVDRVRLENGLKSLVRGRTLFVMVLNFSTAMSTSQFPSRVCGYGTSLNRPVRVPCVLPSKQRSWTGCTGLSGGGLFAPS